MLAVPVLVLFLLFDDVGGEFGDGIDDELAGFEGIEDGAALHLVGGGV